MCAVQPYRSIGDMKIWLKQNIKLRSRSDTKYPYIRSCLISPTKEIVFADEHNKRLIVYSKDGVFTRDICLSGRPFDLETIYSDRIVVSYGIGKYVEIINLQNGKVDKRMKLNGFCSGISYLNGRLFVLVNGIGIQEIDLVKNTMTTLEANVGKAFVLTTTENRIYYTDLETNTLCCCDMTGMPLWDVTSPLLDCIQSISADVFGNVFMAATQSNQIVAISSDGQNIRKFLDDKQGIILPVAVYYDKSDKCLLICNRDSRQAYMYNLM